MLYPRAVNVTPLEGYTLQVMFNNGELRCFDVTPYLTGGWWDELLDPTVFKTVRVAGVSIEWPGGQDIAPDCLYHNSIPCDR